ncbi:MAG: polyprenyl synthetase family protein [Oscillospiraceae bacterium]|nr:polyprenyl synthetase family protein [Oscillospiraceae bacterium]
MITRYEADLAEVERALEETLSFPEDKLQRTVVDAMRYSVLGGGKRIRAVLALEVCKALGSDKQKAMIPACALEMVHAYSLIHDDLPCMDDDDVRRGKPSCHIKFGEDIAVLAGDGLQTLAFETLSSDSAVEKLGADKCIALVRCLSNAIGENGMLGGQTIDIMYEGKQLNEKDHREMAAMKTGALLTAAVECGCIAAGASKEQTDIAKRFGMAMGTAFQIIDDILDVVSDTETLGKPAGSDIKENKNTFVTMLGLEGAKAEAKKLTDESLELLGLLCPDNEFLPQFICRLLERTF